MIIHAKTIGTLYRRNGWILCVVLQCHDVMAFLTERVPFISTDHHDLVSCSRAQWSLGQDDALCH